MHVSFHWLYDYTTPTAKACIFTINLFNSWLDLIKIFAIFLCYFGSSNIIRLIPTLKFPSFSNQILFDVALFSCSLGVSNPIKSHKNIITFLLRFPQVCTSLDVASACLVNVLYSHLSHQKNHFWLSFMYDDRIFALEFDLFVGSVVKRGLEIACKNL